MNEQLVVKNFGPIKDATVDFKRVTVFIGPTGGGKSTLAKLAAIFREPSYNSLINPQRESYKFLSDFSIMGFRQPQSDVTFLSGEEAFRFIDFENGSVVGAPSTSQHLLNKEAAFTSTNNLTEARKIIKQLDSNNHDETEKNNLVKKFESIINQIQIEHNKIGQVTKELLYLWHCHFFPSNRNLLPAVEYSWAGFLRDDIGLPKDTLKFANDFSVSRKDVSELDIPFLNAKYTHSDGKDFIKIPESETLFRLYETASGIQSVTPLLVLLEHLSRNTEQAQSFIIEEPELNLYPTAQQGLLNWLVEKCTKGENDLTITTHSPYLLAHLNLLLYAYQVAENHPERADEVAKIVPRESWINPKEFSAYHVEGQQENGVRSIVNSETGLISYNGLDAIATAETSEFEKLLDINAGLEVE